MPLGRTKWFKFNGKRQFMIYAHGVENIKAIKESTEAFLVVNINVDLELHAERIKYIFMSRDKVTDQYKNMLKDSNLNCSVTLIGWMTKE
jgi:hypothetical protein